MAAYIKEIKPEDWGRDLHKLSKGVNVLGDG